MHPVVLDAEADSVKGNEVTTHIGGIGDNAAVRDTTKLYIDDAVAKIGAIEEEEGRIGP